MVRIMRRDLRINYFAKHTAHVGTTPRTHVSWFNCHPQHALFCITTLRYFVSINFYNYCVYNIIIVILNFCGSL